MTSFASSSVELDLSDRLPPELRPPRPMLVVEGARRDALWAWLAPDGRLAGGRIADRGAAELLAQAVADGAARLGHKLAQTCAVAVGLGPGSYTGLRIEMSFAKGVALALELPLIGVPSLAAMLDDRPRRPEVACCSMLNAFAGQVFAHGERAGGGAWIASDVYLPAALSAAWRGEPRLSLVTDGPLPPFPELVVQETATLIDLKALGSDLPVGLALAAAARLHRGAFDDPYALVPMYGQESSAERKKGSPRQE